MICPHCQENITTNRFNKKFYSCHRLNPKPIHSFIFVDDSDFSLLLSVSSGNFLAGQQNSKSYFTFMKDVVDFDSYKYKTSNFTLEDISPRLLSFMERYQSIKAFL